MSASKRFGYSMFTGALISAVLVAWTSAKHRAQLAAGAAAHHTSPGEGRLVAFVAGTIVIGLVVYAITAARGAKSAPRQQAQRGYR